MYLKCWKPTIFLLQDLSVPSADSTQKPNLINKKVGKNKKEMYKKWSKSWYLYSTTIKSSEMD